MGKEGVKNSNIVVTLYIDDTWAMRLFSFPEQMSDLPQLQMSFIKDILKGLAHLHDMLQVPLDLGARSCQVTQNLTIKVFGTGVLE